METKAGIQSDIVARSETKDDEEDIDPAAVNEDQSIDLEQDMDEDVNRPRPFNSPD
jgi:hypothetical protein